MQHTKKVSIILLLAFVLTMVMPVSAFAASFSDVPSNLVSPKDKTSLAAPLTSFSAFIALINSLAIHSRLAAEL